MMAMNTIPELQLRWKCSRGTVYNLLIAGKLQAVKLGGATRITDQEVERYEAELPKATFAKRRV